MKNKHLLPCDMHLQENVGKKQQSDAGIGHLLVGSASNLHMLSLRLQQV